MKVLIIGGSGFIGQLVVSELLRGGHEVAVLHRGQSKPGFTAEVKQIHGDRNRLGDYVGDFKRFLPEVVIDLVLSSGRQAESLTVFHGIARRVVVVSSQDVYRTYGILLGHDTGPLQPIPITENSELRSYKPVSPEHLKQMQSVFSWVDDEYDKVDVERVVMKDTALPATILRLPMIYGPGDPLHRLFPIVKRMDDGRGTILLDENIAGWKAPRGYVEDIAHAIVLATLSKKATGRIYNVAEEEALTEAEWTRKVGAAAGWKGTVHVMPSDRIPAQLRMPYNTRQQWVVSSDRIREELGYAELVPRETALSRTIEWERANPPGNVPPALFDYAAEDAALAAV